MANRGSAQMVFEALVPAGHVEHISEHWGSRAFAPDSLSYQGPPHAFIIEEVMIDREVIAQAIPAEHLPRLVSLIPVIEWATRLGFKVRTIGTTAQRFRATIVGTHVE